MKTFSKIFFLFLFFTSFPFFVSASVDGVCSSANGQAFYSSPSDLCSAGTASSITGDGPWIWTCNGSDGGSTASCNANKIIDGVCSSANGQAFYNLPSNLCSAGSTSSVIPGDTSWSWTCNGVNGGSTASCNANKIIDGVCGLSNGLYFLIKPTTYLCSQGITSQVIDDGPWAWICGGINGGKTANCGAYKTTSAVNGACGSANNQSFTGKPESGLCFLGTASRVYGDGPWIWSCNGSYGGATVYCIAKKKSNDITNGVCGSANGKLFSSEPAVDLCLLGKASSVINDNKSLWTWTCNGSNGGTNANCYASKKLSTNKIDGSCGSSHTESFSTKPEVNMCLSGTVSIVSGDGPWIWICSGIDGGTNVACYANKKPADIFVIDGKCGSANGQLFTARPTMYLCSSGWSGSVYGDGPWIWSCNPKNGGSKAFCYANKGTSSVVNGICGLSNGQSFTKTPIVNLCLSGTASVVSGDGPWMWACNGINGGTTDSCSAEKILECGLVNNTEVLDGTLTSSSPNLCNTGKVINFQLSNDRYYWKCDKDGLVSSWCNAKIIFKSNGVCGLSNGKSFSLMPTKNLCVSGTYNDVTSDDKNWYWNCKGINGGNDADCSAIKVPMINGECGLVNNTTVTADSLTEKSSGLCSLGNVINFQIYNNKYYWRCSDKTSNTISVWCSASIK
ncbi:MAG: hypothetical protein PHR47_03525 [Candidatus Pacebacteria bacterium]|nr:hypothetical protein [Candidatus Paceibacterota bacterium]